MPRFEECLQKAIDVPPIGIEADTFKEVQELAFDFQRSNVITHLRRAKLSFFKPRRNSAIKKKRQTVIAELFN